jgi:dTDP-4-dehydrorhamnose 3,5-epimerase
MIRKFQFLQTKFKGPLLITPFKADDERGYFIKDYTYPLFSENNITEHLREVFYTHSHKGVIRAIHFQSIKEQAKIVRCIKGKIYDVIVDLRPDSLTFGQWEGFYLDESNNLELFVPQGFGHGYHVLEDSIVSYKCTEDFYAQGDDGILYNDSELNIDWKIENNDSIILSDKDKNLQSFSEFKKKLGL